MGIKKNFIFSTVLTVSNYLFPFIIYPYVARVLEPTNVGIVNYVDSIVNFAMLFSMMGLTIIGVREIAKAKGNKLRLDTTFTSLIALATVTTLLSTIALVIATYAIPDLYPYRKMLGIGVVKLWSNFLLIDWLYKGLEDFKYITIRTIAVKMAYLVSVFVFVHKASDYVTYYWLLCLMVTVNAAFNCGRAFKIVSLRFEWETTKRIIRPFIVLGIYLFLNSMYTVLNVLYLGAVWGDTEVGYYTTATKVFKIILGVYTAYSSVVMPRASALLSDGRIEDFKRLIHKSVDALILIAVPAVFFTMLFSPGIVYTVAGNEYAASITPMVIVMPLIFIIGYEQILVMQILTPMSSDKIILFNSIVGASVGVIFNILLVDDYAAVGSAMVWTLSEVSVLICAQYFVTRRTSIHFPLTFLFKNIVAYLPYAVISVLIIFYLPGGPIVQMIVGAVVCLPYFFAVQRYYLRNVIFTEMYAKAEHKLRKLRRR